MDIFATGNSNPQRNSKMDQIRLGRPLWGARIESMQHPRRHFGASTAEDTQRPAYVRGELSPSRRTGVWMATLYCLYQRDQRCDENNPTNGASLAHAAAKRMLDPATRVNIVQQFATSNFEGIANVGDLGELVAAIILYLLFRRRILCELVRSYLT